jgi:hypothetical protein
VEGRLGAGCIESLVVVARKCGVSKERDRVLSILVLRLKAILAVREKATKTRGMWEK